jgi:tetratricopeptide (TPR) repeat protein/peroxiredoxin
VSLSPTQESSSSDILQYDKGWAAVNKLIRQGRSFSGRERNCCFLNIGLERFANVSATTELDYPDDGRGLVVTDWDWDGKPDFWMTNRNGPRVRFLRNEYATENGFLRLQCVGKTVNRDAIGARVEVKLRGVDQARINTVRAGSGYLSQSTKWLHFGLGASDEVERIDVQWPGGSRESFSGAQRNGHFSLVEGTGVALPIAPPKLAKWKPSSTTERESGAAARVVLLEPAPFPRHLHYYDLQGQETPVVAHDHNRPLLINFWATWCPNCLKELTEWRESSPQFDAAGLQVLALSTDARTNLESDGRTIGAFAKRMKLPFSIGLTDPQVVETLNAFQRGFFGRQSDLPLPSSVLVDRHGRVAVIYKGPASAQQVLRDVALLDESSDVIMAGAIPFDGQWIEQPPPSKPRSAAIALVENGQPAAAEAYMLQLLPGYVAELERIRAMGPAADEIQLDAAKREVSELSHFLGAVMFDRGDKPGAITHYQRSLDLFPSNRLLRREQFIAMRDVGDYAGAAQQLELIVAEPGSEAEDWWQLARMRRQLGELSKAITAFEKSLELSDLPNVHFDMANALRDAQQFAQARQHYEAAMLGLADSPIVANNLAWLLATTPDDQLRNGPRAIELATRAVELTKRQIPEILGTLAAAQAETGNFDQAQATIAEAIELASAANKADVVRELQQKAELYRSGSPYRVPRKEVTTEPNP